MAVNKIPAQCDAKWMDTSKLPLKVSIKVYKWRTRGKKNATTSKIKAVLQTFYQEVQDMHSEEYQKDINGQLAKKNVKCLEM